MVFHMPYFSWFSYLLAALFQKLLESALTIFGEASQYKFHLLYY